MLGLIVTQGTPYQYASFCSPPESVRMTRAWEARAAQVEIAERLDQRQLEPESALERRPRTRVDRKDDGSVDPAQAVGDPPEPLGLRHVRLAVHGREGVPARLEAKRGQDLRALAGEWGKQTGGVSHHIADHDPPARHALALQ